MRFVLLSAMMWDAMGPNAVSGLDHVRWIGGGTGSGKTTMARLLAKRFRLAVYSADDAIGPHADRLSATSAPLLMRFRHMSMDERWLLRDPTTMYRTFPWFLGEGFDLVIQDLRALPHDSPILAEGFRLLPHLVRPHLSDRQHAIWLIPSSAFRRVAFTARHGREAFWLRTSDPPRALRNLLERDEMFAHVVTADAASHGLNTLVVDPARSVESTVEDLARRFGLLQ